MRQQFLRLLGGVARKIRIQHRLEICRDPKDDKLLHVALNGEAQYLVTGDGDLLVLSSSFSQSHGLRIVSPNDWLDLPPG